MNFALYRAMLKQQSKKILGFALGSSTFLLMETFLYPSIEEAMKAKMDIFETLPDGMLAAFGLDKGFAISSVLDLFSVQYYSLIFLVLLSLFTVSMANQLLSHFVEQGSMAYLLSIPVNRKQITFTMISVFFTGLLVIMVCNFLFPYVGSYLNNVELDWKSLFQLNLLGFLLFFAIGGYSFFFSALFLNGHRVLAWAGGLTLIFYILDMIGKVNQQWEDLRYGSIFTLFQPTEIITGDVELYSASLILFSLGIIGYFLTIAIFQRKDLPL
ncbi:ABC transporter permease subunit [Risungbinella massiliensis]|uniref:ABC transporter permease subunit n=1 Tax=Risungbinella massiliensis TaxID=1329796 RepID=UPI0005CB8ED1|nr:ABC transporter permease subunit [Risungbinella massiliensis]